MKRSRAFAVLPTLFTLGNAACGFGAITIAAKVGPENMDGSELFIASLLIFLAMLFDMLDGRVARWARHESEFGAQLDSLCDGLSFGAAPAFLMLQFHQQHQITTSGYYSRILWVIAALFVICALLRLARFNVETEEDDSHEFFSGLPSPAAAATVAAFPIALRGLRNMAEEDSLPPRAVVGWLMPATAAALPLITLAVGVLMVSRFRYPHIFNQMQRRQRNRQQLLQIVFTIALIYLAKEMALPVIFCWFAFAAPVRWFWEEIVAGRLHKSAGT